MDIIKYFSTLGDSTFMNRPYKINRLLFLVFSLFVIGFLVFLYSNGRYYAYVECPVGTSDSCLNSMFNSTWCVEHPDFLDKPVCSSERVFVNPDTGIGSLGSIPPWYFRYYTMLILGLYIVLIIINTLLHNRHLFHKRTADEPIVEDKVFKILIGDDGKEVNDEVNNNLSKDGEGEVRDNSVLSNSSGESIQRGSESEVESSKEGSVETGVESDGAPVRTKARPRFRKGSNNDNV